MKTKDIIKELELNYGYTFAKEGTDNKWQFEWICEMINDVQNVVTKNCNLQSVSGRSELLNHDIKVGDTVLRTTKAQYIVSAFCEDGMIELEDGCNYIKVDRDEVERVV